ncbi:hypothetical protein [Haladaptatus sp. CMAA 1911]|uniref:hypothetical protein n=1 Tax=unclassified Haladaptatus TaxID=2622732 RepID=UPI0037540215
MGSAAGDKSDYEDQYETVIDITEVGADDEGNESITPILEEHADDNTLLYFPSGRYYMDDQFRFTGFNNFGMVGDDAELVPASYDDFDEGGDGNYRLFRMGVDYDPGKDLRIEGFTVDQSADNTGIRVIEAAVDDGLVVRDIEIVGQHDSGTWGPGRFVITDSDGEGLVENFSASDGAVWEGNAPSDALWRGPTGIISNNNKGTLTFRDCILGSFPDNGLYAAHGSGSIQIEGGRFEDSLGANVRLGGNSSYIEDADIIVSEQDSHGIAQRGIRLEEGTDLVVRNVEIQTSVEMSPAIWVTNGADDTTVVDSTITTRADGPGTAISIRESSGRVEIKQTTVDHETDGGPAIKIKQGDKPATLENVTVVGSAPTNGTRSAIQNGRDNSEFRNIRVDHGGGEGRRALMNTANNVVIYEGDYVSEDNAIVESGTGTLIENVSALARSGNAGLRITDDAEDVTVTDSHIGNGIDDNSSDGYDGGNNSSEYDGGDDNDGDAGDGADGNSGDGSDGGNDGSSGDDSDSGSDDGSDSGSGDDSDSGSDDGSDSGSDDDSDSDSDDNSGGSVCRFR